MLNLLKVYRLIIAIAKDFFSFCVMNIINNTAPPILLIFDRKLCDKNFFAKKLSKSANQLLEKDKQGDFYCRYFMFDAVLKILSILCLENVPRVVGYNIVKPKPILKNLSPLKRLLSMLKFYRG